MKSSENKGITRREFTAASAVGSFAVLSAKAGVAEDNVDTLKFGLIGCGGRGGGAVVNTLTGNSNLKFVAMADAFEDRLRDKRRAIERNRDKKVQEQVDIQDDMCFVGLDAYKKLLETDVDFIIHATPPYARPMHIEAAVNAGKHIFTEKPVATDAPGIRRFMAAAEKAKEKGLSFVSGTQRRHQKSYLETMAKIHDGEIGDVRAMSAYWNGTLPFVRERKPEYSDLEYRLRNWYNYIWVCGDNIVEQHIHNLDVCNWAMGDQHPRRATASGGRAWKPSEEKYGDLFDNFSVDYEYDKDVHCYSYCRHWNNSSNAVKEFIVGSKGVSSGRNLGKDDIDPYVQEHIDLVASIRNTGPYLNEGQRVAESTFTAILGRDAAYTGQTLEWHKWLKEGPKLVDPDNLSFDKEYPVGPVPVPGSQA